MIGRRCKAGDRLSRAALIGRALHASARRPTGGGARARSLGGCRPPRVPERCAAPRARAQQQNAPRRSATMAGEVHPVPFRTRKLSPPAPRVLRRKAVGERVVADLRGAFARGEGLRPLPPFSLRVGPPVPRARGAGGPLSAGGASRGAGTTACLDDVCCTRSAPPALARPLGCPVSFPSGSDGCHKTTFIRVCIPTARRWVGMFPEMYILSLHIQT